MKAYYDSYHSLEKLTCWYRYGFVTMINIPVIYCFSKKQTSAEKRKFGSEFVNLKQFCDYIRSSWYKIQMMGIPVVGPTFIYCYNKPVVMNSSLPDSTLKKKRSPSKTTLSVRGVQNMSGGVEGLVQMITLQN